VKERDHLGYIVVNGQLIQKGHKEIWWGKGPC